MKSLKLLHVLPSYLPAFRYGGPIYSVHGLCRGLVNLGHDVHVFTTNVDGESDSDVPLGQPVDLDGVQVWYFGAKFFRRLYYSPSMKRALKREVRNFDLVHLHSIFLWPTWMAARVARENNIPYVVSPRGMLVRDLIKRKSRFVKSAWLGLIEKENIEKASAIHVTSRLEEQEVRKFGFNFPPFHVVPNGVDDDYLTTEDPVGKPLHEGPLKKGPYILFLGRLNWKKGLDRLIRALPHIPDIPLAVVGNDEDDYRTELDRIAQEYGVSDRIIFTGPVYGETKKSLLKQATVFVLPSYSENFGMAVVEAMAVGCPVIVTPAVGLSDIVLQGETGIVSGESPEEIASAVNRLIADPALRGHMGTNGRQTALKHFSWVRISDIMSRVYTRLLEEESK